MTTPEQTPTDESLWEKELDHYSLDGFEGPLTLLLTLVQRSEIPIWDVPVRQIIRQFREKDHELQDPEDQDEVTLGAEFLGTTTSLLMIKSRRLLPVMEALSAEQEEEELLQSPELLKHLLDYRQFRDVAVNLSTLEELAHGYFERGQAGVSTERQRPSGLQDITLQDLSEHFQRLLARAAERAPQLIEEEEWRVADKIAELRQLLPNSDGIPFQMLFSVEKGRNELIVTFLALLELMKMGEAAVVRNVESGEILIYHQGT